MMTAYLDMNGVGKLPEVESMPPSPPAPVIEETQYCTLGRKELEKESAYSDAKSEGEFHKDDVPMLPLRNLKKNDFPDYRSAGQTDSAAYSSPSVTPYVWPPVSSSSRPWKMVLVALVVGFILGGVVFSVLWLTVDKLKDPMVVVVWPLEEQNTVIGPQDQVASDNNNTAAPNTTTTTSTSTTGAPSSETTTSPPLNIGGAVYYRWGKNGCPQHNTLLYRGYTAGGRFSEAGATTSTFCLPDTITWGAYNNVTDSTARNILYGAEFQGDESSWLGRNWDNQDVPCAACQATGRYSHMMVPGSTSCVAGWTDEYKGYLMGNRNTNPGSSETICVDSSPDFSTGGASDDNGKLLYFTEVDIGSLPSPPYYHGRELACVVCTH